MQGKQAIISSHSLFSWVSQPISGGSQDQFCSALLQGKILVKILQASQGNKEPSSALQALPVGVLSATENACSMRAQSSSSKRQNNA
jgi:hypothetical protein